MRNALKNSIDPLPSALASSSNETQITTAATSRNTESNATAQGTTNDDHHCKQQE
ncbi:hypothetical protein DPMN_061674 [Dreissena polymorpha]|uniref:Uncharacterized protein n=1 Tax=Dreissena polymorpha TaxID=45954 RepID=A0A9D4HH45_DREPO|nr:hypothetical protein DPMN_061674 [Dreissena polymorpha]